MFRIGADAIRTTKRTRTRGAHGADMETVNSDVLTVLALGGGLGTLLVWLGQRYNLLEQRDEGRCPSCGLIRSRGACGCSR
jgi:hypothetical protein